MTTHLKFVIAAQGRSETLSAMRPLGWDVPRQSLPVALSGMK
jgi:hypothetical protein